MRAMHPRRDGFTLVELLITITIIGILAGISLGALNAARQTARTAKTKATIAKLDKIIMRRYEEYATRRVPISTAGLNPKVAAELRLAALRQLMRLEMPDRKWDIIDPAALNTPITVQASTSAETRQFDPPALSRRYSAFSGEDLGPSECLYLIVSCGSVEDRERFNESEIGDTDDDGQLEFIDGWGEPIGFLRWAPGFCGASDIQSGNADTDHDPFDTHGTNLGAYHLVPLIYSGGPDKKKDIETRKEAVLSDNPYEYDDIGMPADENNGPLDHYDNIHNHHIEQR